MEITDVRVKLIHDAGDRLRAVCTVTFDHDFVVRDVKVVEGANGLFVAMPSRKLTVSCPTCRHKNYVRAKYCNECGGRLPVFDPSSFDVDGRGKLHRDVAHPITPEFRATIQERVIQAFEAEGGSPGEAGYEEIEEQPLDDEEEVVEEYAETQPVERSPRRSDRGEPRPAGGRDEYSSIIAGLRGRPAEDRGSGNRGSGDRGRGQGQGNSGGRGRSGEGDRNRGPDRGSDRGGNRGAPPTGRGGHGGPRRDAQRDRREEPVPAPVRETMYDEAPDVEPVESSRAPAPPKRTPAPRPAPRVEPVPDKISLEEADHSFGGSPESNEDSTPFGAGLV